MTQPVYQLVDKLIELSRRADYLSQQYINEMSYIDGKPISAVMIETADDIDKNAAQLAKLDNNAHFIEPKRTQARRLRWYAKMKNSD